MSVAAVATTAPPTRAAASIARAIVSPRTSGRAASWIATSELAWPVASTPAFTESIRRAPPSTIRAGFARSTRPSSPAISLRSSGLTTTTISAIRATPSNAAIRMLQNRPTPSGREDLVACVRERVPRPAATITAEHSISLGSYGAKGTLAWMTLPSAIPPPDYGDRPGDPRGRRRGHRRLRIAAAIRRLLRDPRPARRADGRAAARDPRLARAGVRGVPAAGGLDRAGFRREELRDRHCDRRGRGSPLLCAARAGAEVFSTRPRR